MIAFAATPRASASPPSRARVAAVARGCRSSAAWACACATLLAGAAAAATPAATAPTRTLQLAPIAAQDALRFSVSEGRLDNEFYRSGPVAAHLVLSAGRNARVVVAFPAGNSGAALWFQESATPAAWGAVDHMRGVRAVAANGDVLYGVEAQLELLAPALTADRAVLGSIRSVRDYVYTGSVPAVIAVAPVVNAQRVVWSRARVDGHAGYRLELQAITGSIEGAPGGPVRFLPAVEGGMRLRLVALTGDRPLTPIPITELVNADAAQDVRAREVLAFLSYREKLLAGSWRFLTYFGRDTLLTLKMLMDVATPALIEAGIGAVLERLDTDGEVAHEEDIGEYAMLHRLRDGQAPDATPFLDYKMIDDDYMLAPIVAAYLLDRADGRQRADSFLARKIDGGDRYGDALVRNLAYVVSSTRAFARQPRTQALLQLRAGQAAGDWRDSEEGLGGGRIPYDVNAVLAPAALEATAQLLASGVLDGFVGAQRATLATAAAQAAVWARAAPPYFHVQLDNDTARARLRTYATDRGLPVAPALDALGHADLSYDALALAADGTPVPVLHSDVSFALAFSQPTPRALARALEAALRPYPAGLLSPAGMLVADPAYAGDPALWQSFDHHHYHGAVVWSWQQALFAAGLQRQLVRSDIGDNLRARLREGQEAIWSAITATRAFEQSELWSWSYTGSRFVIEAFGQRNDDATESNAAQLWSTVYLGVRPPAPH